MLLMNLSQISIILESVWFAFLHEVYQHVTSPSPSTNVLFSTRTPTCRRNARSRGRERRKLTNKSTDFCSFEKTVFSNPLSKAFFSLSEKVFCFLLKVSTSFLVKNYLFVLFFRLQHIIVRKKKHKL